MRPSFYQPSGRLPAQSVLAFLCALAGAGLGAFLYALGAVRAPGYVNAFLTLAYALWLAFLVHAACHLAKVRNPGFMKQAGLLIGLSGWALHWMCWIVFASFDNFRSMPGPSFLAAVADLFAGPGVLLQELGAAIEATEWSEDSYDFFPRAMCWLFEISILVSLPSQAGASRAGRPFCEASQRWAGVTRLPQRFAVDTVLGARQHLAAHPEQLLTALSPQEQCMIVEYLRVPPRALDQFMQRLSHPDGATRQARSKKAAKRSMKNSAKAS